MLGLEVPALTMQLGAEAVAVALSQRELEIALLVA
jgi:hypothetical protein